MADRFLEGRRLERALAGHARGTGWSGRDRRTASLSEVIRDRSCVLGQRSTHGSARARRPRPDVQPLPPGVRDLAQQRLTHELVREREAHRARIDRRRDQPRPLGLVDGIDQIVLGQIAECLEELEPNSRPAGHAAMSMRSRAGLQGLQSLLDREAHALGYFEVERCRTSGASRCRRTVVCCASKLVHDLTEEERVAFGGRGATSRTSDAGGASPPMRGQHRARRPCRSARRC